MVEGAKSISEVLQSGFDVAVLVATPGFLEANQGLIHSFNGDLIRAAPDDLEKLGDFKSNDSALAVVRMKEISEPQLRHDSFYIVLDDVRDPGNLGTIIRIADWYGIISIIASPQTADVYNPKVLSASMGSFTRVSVYYVNLVDYLRDVSLPIIGTFLSGEDVHQIKNISGGLLVIGNEANGISQDVASLVTKRVTIPRYGKAESLNAAVATAIVCDNLIRPKIAN